MAQPEIPRQRSSSNRQLFRSRLSPSLADALSVNAVLGHFAAFLSYRGSAAMVRFWLAADSKLKAASSSSKTNSSAAREIAESCGLSDMLTDSDFDKGVAHCQYVVGAELQNRYFEEFKASPYFANYQLELLNETLVASNVSEGERLSLDDVVFYEISLFYFREFVEQLPQPEQASLLLAMLNFYLTAAAFEREYRSETALSDALNIYETYLSLNASRRIEFPDSIRRAVEESISVETGQPSPSTFELALENVHKLLSGEGVIGKFFVSAPFQHLVSEVRRRAGVHQTHQSISSKTSIGEDDRDSIHSSSSRTSSAIRRFTSLRVARIDDVTGAYISEFKDPQSFEAGDSHVPLAPRPSIESNNKIKRMFNIRGKAEQLRNQELEAERKAAEIVGEITAILASSQSTSPDFDQ